MVKLAESGIFPNADFTLKLPLVLGIVLGFLSVACFVTFLVLALSGVAFGGLTAWLFPSLGLLVSILLICQGFANIHLRMIYHEVQNRPKYIVSEKRNIE